MGSQFVISPASGVSESAATVMDRQALVRYGSVPQVARYEVTTQLAEKLTRGVSVVVQTDRGLEMGELLEILPPAIAGDHPAAGPLERVASPADLALQDQRRQEAAAQFDVWQQRIIDWKLEIELVDYEQTLDEGKHVLYVLNQQDAETTRLALLAAAGGLGIVSVQPVSADGIVDGSGGGCGSGCGCGS